MRKNLDGTGHRGGAAGGTGLCGDRYRCALISVSKAKITQNGNNGGTERRDWAAGARCPIAISDVLKHALSKSTELVVIAVGLGT